DALLKSHGQYLLRHFRVIADGVPLGGEVRELRPPDDRSVKGFTSYTLRYALPHSVAQVEVRQDLLTEILYSPGNPWEAPLVARAWRDEHPLIEGALLTAKQPLRIALAQGIASEFREAPRPMHAQ